MEVFHISRNALKEIFHSVSMSFRPQNNGRTSDNVRPKSKFIRPNEKHNGLSV